MLLKDNPLTKHDKRLFEVLKHFNHSLSLIHHTEERLQLAQYNLWAGQKAKAASAYDVANKYLSAGIKFLKPINWEENYNLGFQMYKEITVCKYLMGNTKAANNCFLILLKHTQNLLDEIEVHSIKMEMLSALGKHPEAVKVGLSTLRNIGVKIPKKNLTAHILLTVFKIKWQLKGRRVETLSLPLMTDLKQIAIANLLTHLLDSAFFVDTRLTMLLVCKHISLSLRYGYTESTAVSIPAYASFLMCMLNWYDEALSFVTFNAHLQKKYGKSSFSGRGEFMLGYAIEPYQKPIHLCNNTVLKAFQLCCEEGDIAYANYCNFILVYHSLLLGKSLGEVKKNIHLTVSFMARAKVTDFTYLATFYDYLTQCLEHPDFIKTEHQELALFEQNIIKGKIEAELVIFYNNLTTLHFLLGNIKEAVKAGQNHARNDEYDKNFIL